ncbi:hypothetical protein [Synechocystis sp. LKSZ1]|uniref:hypothetical protein n=1 Tax=Synechocystis sp. LKSZ1 TaxID=3144951 RepID=UPI00336BD525
MEVDRPDARPLTPAEMEEYEQLKAIIEKAIADQVLTHDEFTRIRAKALGSNPSPELLYQEFNLYRELVTSQIQAGKIIREGVGD